MKYYGKESKKGKINDTVDSKSYDTWTYVTLLTRE